MPGTLDDRYQTEYKGEVGFEKKDHQTHFAAPGRKFRHTRDNGYVWVEYRPGRWRLLKKDDNPV